MKKIIIFGAGRSSTSLIEYLLSIAEEQQIFITLLDYNEELAKSKIIIINLVKPHFIDANNQNERLQFIRISTSYIHATGTYAFRYSKDAINEKVHVITQVM